MEVYLKGERLPWLGGSVGWSIVLCTKRLWVGFPVEARTQVADLIPGQGAYEKQPVDVSISLSLPSLSKINKRIFG